MEPIFNAHGHAVGWLKEAAVRNLNGTTVAWVNGDTLYDLSGSELGKFSSGFFRVEGAPFAFVKGASGGPILPITAIPPIPPIPDIPPIKPIFGIPSIPSIPSLSWSSRSHSAAVPGL